MRRAENPIRRGSVTIQPLTKRVKLKMNGTENVGVDIHHKRIETLEFPVKKKYFLENHRIMRKKCVFI